MPVFYEIVKSLWVRCGVPLTHLGKIRLENWDRHPHHEVLTALRGGDGDSARAAIQRDISMGRNAISEMTEASTQG